jgi:hypothetical protein
MGKGVQIEKRTVKEFQPDGDPEAMKRRAEKMIEDKIKSRKKLDAKRRQTHVRFGGMKSERIMEEEEGDHKVGVGRYDDEGDGFVVSDDEEIEERGGRLSRIKAQGAQKYKDRRHDSEEEDEEEEEDEDEEEAKEEADDTYNERKQETPRKSRRRIVDDDDED